MQMKKFALRGLGALAAAVALCLLFSGTVRTLTTPKVRYAPVKNGKFESVAELTGKVVFPEAEELTLDIPEGQSLTVTRVLVTPGQKVKQGDKLLTATVADADKTLATLQQDYDTARNTLDAWDRKNSTLRLSRAETRWMEAWETARDAEKREQETRLDLLALLEDLPEAGAETETGASAADGTAADGTSAAKDGTAAADGTSAPGAGASGEAAADGTAASGAEGAETGSLTGAIPEALPEGADETLTAAWNAWQAAARQAETARQEVSALDRYAIPEETWTLLQQRKEAEAKLADAESQMMSLRLLMKRAESVTAPHAGYVTAVPVTKGGSVLGDDPLLSLTPEETAPVIRADISQVKQTVAKGTAISIVSDSWGRVETKVTATGLDDTGHPYADAEITEDVTWALGPVSTMMKEDVKLRLTTRAQEATCLVPASAVRGSGDGRYVYVGEQQSSAFAGTQIIVRKTDVTVLAESASTVSVAEDLSYSKVLYMEDRVINEGGAVMLYEE